MNECDEIVIIINNLLTKKIYYRNKCNKYCFNKYSE